MNDPLPAYRCAKRALDIVLSATALLVLLPLFIPLMIILRLSGEGEVFYRQERVGYRGNRFGLSKFVKIIGQGPPGLSGVGSIVFRDEESVLANSHKPPTQCYAEDIAPYKGRLEVWYVEHRSFWLDLKLIFITVWVIAFPRSAFYQRWLESPNQTLTR